MLCGGGVEPELRVLPTAEISAESLHTLLSDWAFRRVVLCSVVPWAAEEISSFMKGVELIHVRPENVNDIQMCAAVGQARFICEYENLFAERGVKIGQVLLTHDDFEDRRKSQNVKMSLDHLVRAGIVPIVNENDVVADDEIKGHAFGDNDWLSFLIAKLVRADTLVLLTTVDGLLDATGKKISEVVNFAAAMRLVRGGEKGKLSKGGMDSKLKAVKAAVKSGIDTFIANGHKAVLPLLASGKQIGTFFPGNAL
jgi:glutamate 5-kinase